MPNKTLHIIVTLLLMLSTASVSAEDIAIRTSNGTILVGTVVFENAEVIIISTADGSRYQYRRADVEILDGVEVPAREEEKNPQSSERRASVQIRLNGGAATIPHYVWGGMVGAQLAIGANKVAGKKVFLGGIIGYEAMFADGKTLSYLPIAVAAQVPLMQKNSAPFLGASMGYGIALSKSYTGGLYATADLGWRWQMNNKKAIMLALNVTFLQTRINISETIDLKQYINHTGRCITQIGGLFIIEL